VYAGAVSAGLFREPMCPISSIVSVEFARMPGDSDGGSTSFRPTPITKPINMQPRNSGARKIRITGSITGAPIPTIGKETVRNKNNATANAASPRLTF